MHKLYLSFHEDKFYSKQKNTKELEHLTPFKKKKYRNNSFTVVEAPENIKKKALDVQNDKIRYSRIRTQKLYLMLPVSLDCSFLIALRYSLTLIYE